MSQPKRRLAFYKAPQVKEPVHQWLCSLAIKEHRKHCDNLNFEILFLKPL